MPKFKLTPDQAKHHASLIAERLILNAWFDGASPSPGEIDLLKAKIGATIVGAFVVPRVREKVTKKRRIVQRRDQNGKTGS